MYRNLRQCVNDLEAAGQLRRVDAPIDANLEAAEIQRRVFRAGGPALLLTNVVGCRFPMLCNLFGTMERTRYMFRDSLERLQATRYVAGRSGRSDAAAAAVFERPVVGASDAAREGSAPGRCWPAKRRIDELPQLKSWPDDGGAYITLPQVYTEDPDAPGLATGNLGMYRVQLSGGQYAAQPRGRPALPDPSRHRRPSCRRACDAMNRCG